MMKKREEILAAGKKSPSSPQISTILPGVDSRKVVSPAIPVISASGTQQVTKALEQPRGGAPPLGRRVPSLPKSDLPPPASIVPVAKTIPPPIAFLGVPKIYPSSLGR